MFGGRKNNQIPRRVQAEQTPSVFSYHSNRPNPEISVGRNIAPRNAKKFKWYLLPTYLAVAAMVASFMYMTTLDNNPRVVISGESKDQLLLQPISIYQAAAKKEISHSVTNRSKLTLNSEALAEKLTQKFPEIAEVSITIPIGGRRPIIEIQPAHPTLILNSTSGTYILDNRGKALIESNRVDKLNQLDLPIVADESGLEVKTGQIVLPSDTGKFIDQVTAQLKAKQLELESLTLPAIANELHVRLKGRGYFTKFNMSGDARVQVGTLVAVIEKLDAEKKKPDEYVDVRVEEKAFYR